MTPALQAQIKFSRGAMSAQIPLGDGRSTTVHIVRYARASTRPRVMVFDQATSLLAWCTDNNRPEAIVGGFFLRDQQALLGDVWIGGRKEQTVAFESPWNNSRGSLHVDTSGKLELNLRDRLPASPDGDLLQCGPLLVKAGVSQVQNNVEGEGFSHASHQFDSDITKGRYPRAAIGVDKDWIWCVVGDGRTSGDAGMTLSELADFMIMLGVTEALNLDGGSSASLVSGGKLVNHPRSDDQEFPRGRPIYSAIILEPR